MKIILPILAALVAFAPLHADSKKKTAKGKNPALADTWAADTKTYEGKKVTTTVLEIGDFGGVSSDSSHAIVPVITGTAAGDPGAEIPVIVPTAKLKAFIAGIEPKKQGGGGSFGGKVKYATLSATFSMIQGEPTLVYGDDLATAAKAGKPSDLLKAQLEAAKSAETSEEDAGKTDKKSDKPEKNGKKKKSK